MDEREFSNHVSEYRASGSMGPLVPYTNVPENWLSVIVAAALRDKGRYAAVLQSYGIMCPHPRSYKERIGDGWFECGLCGCTVADI